MNVIEMMINVKHKTVLSKMLNIFRKLILWFKKIFHIRSEPTKVKPRKCLHQGEKSALWKEKPPEIKPPEEEILEVPPDQKLVFEFPPEVSKEGITLVIKSPEKKIPQILPEKKIEGAPLSEEGLPQLPYEKEPIEAKLAEGITPEVPIGQRIPTEFPSEVSEEGFTPAIKSFEKKIPQILPEKKIEGAPLSEEGLPQLPSEKEPVEAVSSKEKAPDVLVEQKILSQSPPEASEEEIIFVEPERISKPKLRKPYKKKAPMEERKNLRKLPEEEKRSIPSQSSSEIDLGKRRKGRKTTKRHSLPEVHARDKPEEKELITRVESPYVEINLNEAKIFLIIPRQQFRTTTANNIPQQLHYKLELNGYEQTISAKVGSDKQSILTVEEKRVDLEQPLKKFKVGYPDELQGRVYSYQHSDETLYPFIGIGNNNGRMYYLYDNEGDCNPLPKRDIWILLKEDFDLATPDIIEERWFWEKYQPMRINLKNKNELIIKNRQTGDEEKKILCESTFSIEGDELVVDDFKEQNPIFAGKTVKIKAPIENLSGWRVWIQNRQDGKDGNKIVFENWTGAEALELNLPDDLPCECGEFQVDICEQENRTSRESLFFRYIPHLQLKFPSELIVPDPDTGHKKEIIQILLGKDFQDWELKIDEGVQHKCIDNGYQVELLPEQDTFSFSLMKQDKPETETSLQITIPRLKWKTSKNKTWYDKPLQIERNQLIRGEDFYLIVCTNDFEPKYDLSATLEPNLYTVPEKFTPKGIVHNLLLNRFYDTIQKNEDRITLRIEIRKAKNDEVLNQVNIIYFLEIPKEKVSAKTPNQNLTPIVRGGRRKMRKGKGFSKEEVNKAGIHMNAIRRLRIPYDKRRKTMYLENIETLKSLIGGE